MLYSWYKQALSFCIDGQYSPAYVIILPHRVLLCVCTLWEQFNAPEVFDADSKAAFSHFGKHLGDIVIAPQYVQRQCDRDREDCEVNLQLFMFRA